MSNPFYWPNLFYFSSISPGDSDPYLWVGADAGVVPADPGQTERAGHHRAGIQQHCRHAGRDLPCLQDRVLRETCGRSDVGWRANMMWSMEMCVWERKKEMGLEEWQKYKVRNRDYGEIYGPFLHEHNWVGNDMEHSPHPLLVSHFFVGYFCTKKPLFLFIQGEHTFLWGVLHDSFDPWPCAKQERRSHWLQEKHVGVRTCGSTWKLML